MRRIQFNLITPFLATTLFAITTITAMDDPRTPPKNFSPQGTLNSSGSSSNSSGNLRLSSASRSELSAEQLKQLQNNYALTHVVGDLETMGSTALASSIAVSTPNKRKVEELFDIKRDPNKEMISLEDEPSGSMGSPESGSAAKRLRHSSTRQHPILARSQTLGSHQAFENVEVSPPENRAQSTAPGNHTTATPGLEKLNLNSPTGAFVPTRSHSSIGNPSFKRQLSYEGLQTSPNSITPEEKAITQITSESSSNNTSLNTSITASPVKSKYELLLDESSEDGLHTDSQYQQDSQETLTTNPSQVESLPSPSKKIVSPRIASPFSSQHLPPLRHGTPRPEGVSPLELKNVEPVLERDYASHINNDNNFLDTEEGAKMEKISDTQLRGMFNLTWHTPLNSDERRKKIREQISEAHLLPPGTEIPVAPGDFDKFSRDIKMLMHMTDEKTWSATVAQAEEDFRSAPSRVSDAYRFDVLEYDAKISKMMRLAEDADPTQSSELPTELHNNLLHQAEDELPPESPPNWNMVHQSMCLDYGWLRTKFPPYVELLLKVKNTEERNLVLGQVLTELNKERLLVDELTKCDPKVFRRIAYAADEKAMARTVRGLTPRMQEKFTDLADESKLSPRDSRTTPPLERQKQYAIELVNWRGKEAKEKKYTQILEELLTELDANNSEIVRGLQECRPEHFANIVSTESKGIVNSSIQALPPTLRSNFQRLNDDTSQENTLDLKQEYATAICEWYKDQEEKQK